MLTTVLKKDNQNPVCQSSPASPVQRGGERAIIPFRPTPTRKRHCITANNYCSFAGRTQVGKRKKGVSPGAWAAAPGKAECSRRCLRLRGRQRGRAGYGRCRTSPSRCVPRRRQRAPPPAPSASCASAASPPKTSAAAATGIDHPSTGSSARHRAL